MSESNFRSGIRSAVRGLWSGALTPGQFSDALEAVIQRNLTKAWTEGAADCGVAADELTDQETTALAAFIDNQFGFIDGYGEAIDAESKAEGGKLTPLFARAEKWVGKYSEAKANGHARACADEKSEFVFGPTKEHCGTCRGLRGRVYRNSVWAANDAVPPHNWNFECRGGCHCQLRSTDKPITRGKFPIGLLR